MNPPPPYVTENPYPRFIVEPSICNRISPRRGIAGIRWQKLNCSVSSFFTDWQGQSEKHIFFFFDLKSVSITTILLIFMIKKCDQESMITKTQKILDRVDRERGILLLWVKPLYSFSFCFNYPSFISDIRLVCDRTLTQLSLQFSNDCFAHIYRARICNESCRSRVKSLPWFG